MKTPILPCSDRILVSQLKPKEKTHAGLYIAETAKEPPNFGIVIAVGSQVKDSNLRPQTMVMFGKYSGKQAEIDEKEYLLMREDEVDGIVCDGDLADKFHAQGA